MAIPMLPINITAVVVATIVSFIIGMVWYGPLFGKSWAKMSGVDMKQRKGMAKKSIAMLISLFILNYVLANTMKFVGAASIGEGLLAAFMTWLGYIATVLIGMVIWEGKPVKLYLIHSAHYLALLLLASAIIVSL